MIRYVVAALPHRAPCYLGHGYGVPSERWSLSSNKNASTPSGFTQMLRLVVTVICTGGIIFTQKNIRKKDYIMVVVFDSKEKL